MSTILRSTLAALAAIAATLAIAVPTAQAHDAYPCGSPYRHDITAWFPWGGFYRSHYGDVQRCPLVSGQIPVYYAPRRGSSVIGWVVGGDSRNWFFSQAPACSLADVVPNHGHFNHWWAETVADNLKWGYVNEVFFRGGADYERDGRLATLPGCY